MFRRATPSFSVGCAAGGGFPDIRSPGSADGALRLLRREDMLGDTPSPHADTPPESQGVLYAPHPREVRDPSWRADGLTSLLSTRVDRSEADLT
jgi:hypothetical protein